MKNIFLAFSFLLLPIMALSNNLQISNVLWNSGTGKISFSISWDNSWHDATGEFHDAVWVFVKFAPNGGLIWKHATVSVTDAVPSPLLAVVPSDQKGVFVKRSSEGYGNVPSTTLIFNVLNNDLGPFPDFKVFGIEMVNVPEGAYYLGGGVSGSEEHLHRGNNINEAFFVNTSGILPYGSSSSSWSSNAFFGYTTDIPATYPNGYDQFYAMKYPITQDQYVGFLNTLSFLQQNNRTQTDLSLLSSSDHYVMTESATVSSIYRNGIKADPNSPYGFPLTFFCDLNQNDTANEIDDGQNLACTYLNTSDWLGYADWSALRPLTILEHEKMCRGPLIAVEDERAWGQAGYTLAAGSNTLTNPGKPDESHPLVGSPGIYMNFVCRVGIAATSTSDRLSASAGYYGHLHLSSIGTEFYVPAESNTHGLGYTGLPGDGELTTAGSHNNSDWNLIGSTRKGLNKPIVELNNGSGASGYRGQLNTFRLGR